MRLADFHFRPSWTAALVGLVFFCAFCALGVWQLNRADEKRHIQAEFDALYQAEPLRVGPDHPLTAKDQYRPVEAVGHYLPTGQVFLDNVRHNGRAGYEVITPLQVDGYPELLLVNRGWVPIGRTRADLPAIATPTDPVQLTGLVGLPRSRPLGLGADAPPNPDGGALWLYLNLQTLARQLGQPIAPVLLLLSPDAPTGFVREWPKYDAKVGMHIGYAIHWFVFASAAVVLFLGASLRRTGQSND